MSSPAKKTIFLRAETKGHERRTAVTPENAKKLIETGEFNVVVQRWSDRIFSDAEYESAGCTIVDTDYKDVPASDSTFIFGLKALPKEDLGLPIAQKHVYFAHAFKSQFGWQDTLSRFEKKNGVIYDLEFLVDERGRRVAAFGKPAGIAGAALGLMAFAYQHHEAGEKKIFPPVTSYDHSSHLFAAVRDLLLISHATLNRFPRVIILGAKGRVGGGAIETVREVEKLIQEKLPSAKLETTLWDLEETSKGGPFDEILAHDVFINCIFLSGKIPPFLTKDQISKSSDKKLSVVVDVSCDYDNPNNPIPIYDAATSWEKPCLEIPGGIEVISIDNLPSLIPRESSIAFSNDLFPHLKTIDSGDVWGRAKKVFDEKVSELKKETISEK